MIHDPRLIDLLAALPVEKFSGEAFRATRKSLDPLAPSTRGGRWARDGGSSVLYASLERNGALAEIAFHWGQLTPLPTKPVILHRLNISAHETRRLTRTNLEYFGVDAQGFSEMDYRRTQDIGEALAFLGCDGLIAPSARWPCDNLMLFSVNHPLDAELRVVASEEVDWRAWAYENGMLDAS